METFFKEVCGYHFCVEYSINVRAKYFELTNYRSILDFED